MPQRGKPTRTIGERAALLLSGNTNFLAACTTSPTFTARAAIPVDFPGAAQNHWDDRLICRPDIHEPKQLEGKRILTGPAPCVVGNLRQALERAGVDISTVNLCLPRATAKERTRASPWALQHRRIRRNDVDAANVDMPFDLQAKKHGLNAIELPDLPVIHNTTICANMDFVRENEQTAVTFLKALIEAVHFFKTERDKSCAIIAREVAPLIGLDGDDEVEYLHGQWSALLCSKPYPEPLAVENPIISMLRMTHRPIYRSVGSLGHPLPAHDRR